MTKVFKTPFAAQGDRSVVPVETQADGSVSYTQGYGYDYERDQTTDPAAKDIEREKMNALFHDVTEAVGEIQTFGTPNWSEDGKPYPIRSQVYYSERSWQSRIKNNNEEPGKGSGWIELKADLNPSDINAYSKQESDERYVYKSITVNGKSLSSNINLTANDVNAWNKTEADGRFIYKNGDTIQALNVINGLYVAWNVSTDGSLAVAKEAAFGGNVNIGPALLQTDGNIKGAIWGGGI